MSLHAAKPLPQAADILPAPATTHPLFDAFQAARHGSLTVLMPDGAASSFVGAQPGPQAQWRLHDERALDALVARGEIGLAQSYAEGEWDSPDLPALLTYGLLNAPAFERYFYGRPFYALWLTLRERLWSNGRGKSRRNVMRHYDLGNEFYALWLDRSMTYSCGLFGDSARSLEAAQQAKYMRILARLAPKAGAHLLEIGCGWGGFMEFAARHGYRVTGLTLSPAQQAYANERLQRQGLDGLARAELTDYREVKGQYDHIVSIGMFEHVGEAYWAEYFKTLRARLQPGGRAMVQTITIDEEVFARTQGKRGFIEEMIFPGGCLPSRERFAAHAVQAGLTCHDLFAFGQDYVRTLEEWLRRFEARKAEVRLLGYDESFIRLWRFYLASCIASFASARTSVMQAELHAA